jgi:hypothetical protein
VVGGKDSGAVERRGWVNNVDLTSSGRLVAKGLSQFSRPDTSLPQRKVADHLRIHFTSVSRILWAKDGNANKIDLIII